MPRLASLVAAVLLAPALLAAPVPKANKPQLLVSTTDAKSGKTLLMLVDEEGKNPKELTDAKSNAAYQSWSPDGKKIAFASDREGGRMQVFVMDADGANVKQLTTEATDARVPSWSSDGKRIAYCRRGQFGGSDVVVVDTDGKNAETIGDGDAWDPAFSPDGKKIAFVSNRAGGGFKLHAMDADGKNVSLLVDQHRVRLPGVESGREEDRVRPPGEGAARTARSGRRRQELDTAHRLRRDERLPVVDGGREEDRVRAIQERREGGGGGGRRRRQEPEGDPEGPDPGGGWPPGVAAEVEWNRERSDRVSTEDSRCPSAITSTGPTAARRTGMKFTDSGRRS
jgi:dipeptidyl aminopeptidase/acylaminoacyl peptidase